METPFNSLLELEPCIFLEFIQNLALHTQLYLYPIHVFAIFTQGNMIYFMI